MRPGPRMLDVVRYVADHPGLAMMHAASHVGPRGSLRYGYRTVHRAIRAGMILACRQKNGSMLLYPIREEV